jgi:hypothetical protein
MQQKFRLIFLGAGFSVPAGLPLAAELWKTIRQEAFGYPETLRASKFGDDLKLYVRFLNEACGQTITEDEVDFEDFMRFLDIEHFLGLRGSDTWGPEGNESTIVTKFLIGKILARHCGYQIKIPTLYQEFARRLQPGDTVITFNYDILLEIALEAIGKPYRLFPNRFMTIEKFSNTVDDSQDDEIVVLKMHGSIDWFDSSFVKNSMSFRGPMDLPLPSHSIFSRQVEFGLKKIVSGPRPENEALDRIYRAKNLRDVYREGLSFFEPPKILTPSAAKILYSNEMHDFWTGFSKVGHLNFGLSIVGFSLPQHDEYMRQILYKVITNYQRSYWESGYLDRKKSPLVLVDYFANPEAEQLYRQRYRFVDWEKCQLIGSGFDMASLDKIFSE